MGLTPDIRRDLQWMRDDFTALVAAARPDDLDSASEGTRWTNRQLLFHMWFGQRIARAFVPLIGGFSRLPLAVSVAWSKALTASTGLYEWVNYVGSVGGTRMLGLRAARRWMIADTDWLIRWGDRATAADLARGMSVPVSWDPYFQPWMDRSDLLAWAPKHYQHHRNQLTLPGLSR